MYFASDNAGPVPQSVITALEAANRGFHMSYGNDALTMEVRDRVRDIFEAPEAAVYLVSTGTAANALALSTLGKSWQTIFCSPVAHIHEDECNAPEFFTGGSKLTLVEGHDKITPTALENTIEPLLERGVHGPQPGPLSLTQVTEKGTVYTLNELKALTKTARAHALPVHMDGARFSNALASLDCTPAEMTHNIGIDAVSFGASKNGLMAAEAVVFFDPKYAWEFELRRKRSGHLLSKHRYIAAQMNAYLKDDLWIDLAKQANDNAKYLAEGLRDLPDVTFDYSVDANMMFIQMPRKMHQNALNGGAQYYIDREKVIHGAPTDLVGARLVCDWSVGQENIDKFLSLVAKF